MYRDKTLIPSEAIRLCALGTLALAPASYGALAREVRAFTSRLSGPSLDMMGASIEVLRAEGLIAPAEGEAEDEVGPGTELALTDAGAEELRELMVSNVRSPVDGVSKLVFALKLRFLHLLAEADAHDQIARMLEISETELARLADLKQRYGGEPGRFSDWLELDMGQVEDRIAWLRSLRG